MPLSTQVPDAAPPAESGSRIAVESESRPPNTHSAGHLIVKTLQSHGVRRVYAVPGESYLDVLDGLHDSEIETVVTRHEAAPVSWHWLKADLPTSQESAWSPVDRVPPTP